MINKIICKLFKCKESDFEIIDVYETKNKKKVVKNNIVVTKYCKRCGKCLGINHFTNLSLKQLADFFKI